MRSNVHQFINVLRSPNICFSFRFFFSFMVSTWATQSPMPMTDILQAFNVPGFSMFTFVSSKSGFSIKKPWYLACRRFDSPPEFAVRFVFAFTDGFRLFVQQSSSLRTTTLALNQFMRPSFHSRQQRVSKKSLWGNPEFSCWTIRRSKVGWPDIGHFRHQGWGTLADEFGTRLGTTRR